MPASGDQTGYPEWTLLQLDQHLHRLRPAPMTELEPYSYLPQPQVSPNKLEHQERRRPQRRQGAIEPISLTMIIVTHQRAVQVIGEGMGSYCATAHAARDHGRNRLNMTLGRDQSRIGADARAVRITCFPTSRSMFILRPPIVVIHVSLRETKNDRSTGSARERHGLFRCGAFQAARIRRPSIQYSRVVLPPAPNSWPLNIPAACSVPPALRLSVRLMYIVQQCGPFATYRWVSCLSASTI
jgi:hypothetical protein